MYLLDTHVALWVLSDSPRLGTRARRLVSSGPTLVSAVSVFELQVKAALGKLQIPERFDERLEENGVQSLPLTARHAAALELFPELTHHDPFDRALVAQAHVDRLTLLTVDRRLLARGYAHLQDASL